MLLNYEDYYIKKELCECFCYKDRKNRQKQLTYLNFKTWYYI